MTEDGDNDDHNQQSPIDPSSDSVTPWQQLKKGLKLLEQFVSQKEVALARSYNTARERHPVLIEALRLAAVACLPQLATQIQLTSGQSLFKKEDYEYIAENTSELLQNLKEIENGGEYHFNWINQKMAQEGHQLDLSQISGREVYVILAKAATVYTRHDYAAVHSEISKLNQRLDSLMELKYTVDSIKDDTRRITGQLEAIRRGASADDGPDIFEIIEQAKKEFTKIKPSFHNPTKKPLFLIGSFVLIIVSGILSHFYIEKVVQIWYSFAIEYLAVAFFMYSYASKNGFIMRTPLFGASVYFIMLCLVMGINIMGLGATALSRFEQGWNLFYAIFAPFIALTIEFAILGFLRQQQLRNSSTSGSR